MSTAKKRKRRNPNSLAVQARAAERKQKVWQLKMAGASYRQIGAEVGIAWQTARIYVVERLKELDPHDPEETAQMRREESARLDGYLLNLARGIQAGDTAAIQAAIKISDRKAALWSMNGPVKMADTDAQGRDKVYDDGRSDEELLSKVERILAFHRRKAEADGGGTPGDPREGKG